jgi:hypothetical protein
VVPTLISRDYEQELFEEITDELSIFKGDLPERWVSKLCACFSRMVSAYTFDKYVPVKGTNTYILSLTDQEYEEIKNKLKEQIQKKIPRKMFITNKRKPRIQVDPECALLCCRECRRSKRPNPPYTPICSLNSNREFSQPLFLDRHPILRDFIGFTLLALIIFCVFFYIKFRLLGR